MQVFPRCSKEFKHDFDSDIIFQAVSWHACDHEYGDDSDEDAENEHPISSEKFLVKVFGVTENGNTVSASITKFPPFFFIKVPHKITSMFSTYLKTYLKTHLPFYAQGTVKSVKIIPMKDFWGFQNGKQWKFVRITFTNMKGMRAAIKLFETSIHIKEVTKQSVKYTLYESNVEPFLRLIHTRDLQPTGWIKIPAGFYQQNPGILPTTCQIDVMCEWACLQPVVHIEKIAPIMVAAFDLECNSSHGDFPVAKKDYKKVATDLYYYAKDVGDEITCSDIVHELASIFNPDTTIGKLPKVFTKHSVSDKQSKEIKNKLKHCSDVYSGILRGRITQDPESGKFVGSTRIMKKEEVLATLTARLNQDLPQLEGDSIIQIGVTVHQYGDRDCSYRHIITLGTCEEIQDAVVESCSCELEMLQRFRDLIVKLDPDVVTGYNILGFDMDYLYERSDELGFKQNFMKIGRFREVVCKREIKTLSSSALGDNILKYIDMHGRVIIDIMKVVQRDHKLDSYKLDNVANHFMNMNKHDVSPKEIFSLQKGDAADRKIIANYCLQDCALCNRLIMKLEILANNIGMSNVCSVPLSYIFMRGQGIKIFSLVSKQCREEKMCIPSLSKPYSKEEIVVQTEDDEDDSGYEGAIVLEPKTGIYLDDPVSVLDYASLYPSSMISENLSHDCIVLDPAYDNLDGMEYVDISYDLYEGVGDKKTKVGVKTCRFVQLPNGEKGIIPRILMKLLKARKDTRKKMTYQTLTLEDGNEINGMVSDMENGEKLKIARIDGTSDIIESNKVKSRQATYDEFQLAVLDGLQLAYKVTANSLYGQCGARTSQIYMKEIAACTTATGRKMILTARDFIIDNYSGAEIVYGDTDSLFVKFPIKSSDTQPLDKKLKIRLAWESGCEASSRIKKIIKPPHDLEMEKVFYPFILFSKKRYCAYKYEGPDSKPKLNSMGIVLKRRDNANIVKKVYGGCLDIIMNENDVRKSADYLKKSIQDLIDGKYPLEDLVITKSLKADYKDPERIAHKVLAERMGERDPGNKPQVNDRIPFAYVEQPTPKKGKKILQGERIEHPDYIREMNLKLDYEFYITNQISTPVCQLYSLALDQLPGYRRTAGYWDETYKKLVKDKEGDVKKAKEKLTDLKETEAKTLLFDPILIKLKNRREGNQDLTKWFKPI